MNRLSTPEVGSLVRFYWPVALRQILACQKKRMRQLYRHLIRLGISEKSASNACFVMRSPWALSASKAMHKAYSNAWFAERIELLHARWLKLSPVATESVYKQLLLFEVISM